MTMATLKQDDFLPVRGKTDEVCERRWPQPAIAELLGMTLRAVQESVTQAIRDERTATGRTP